jgi:formate C-acetyltransferase
VSVMIVPDVRGDAWEGFAAGRWTAEVDVRDFIQRNYSPYHGDGGFLAGPTQRTLAVWARIVEMLPVERERGVYDVDPSIPSSITAHAPGYIDRERELIVGLQTDAPLRRARSSTPRMASR